MKTWKRRKKINTAQKPKIKIAKVNQETIKKSKHEATFSMF